ncbi:MAG TPA: hypothetical protein VIK55_06475 [Paludibacter sp.]
MELSEFYMVFVEGEHTPTFKHSLYDSALTEAKRLTEKTSKTSYVLGTIVSVKLPEKFIIDDVNVSQLPF